MASVTVTSASPAVVTWTSHGLYNGSCIRFLATELPAGILAGTNYYARWASASSVTLSSINTRAMVTFDLALNKVLWPAHGLVNGQSVYFQSSGVLPTDLVKVNSEAVPTTYTVTNATADDFQLSGITLGGNPSGVHNCVATTPVNTTTTGVGVTAYQYDPGFSAPAPLPNFVDGMLKLSNVALAVVVKISGIVPGSMVLVESALGDEVLSLGVAPGTNYQFTTKFSGNCVVSVRKGTGSPAYTPYEALGYIDPTRGMNMIVSQQLD